MSSPHDDHPDAFLADVERCARCGAAEGGDLRTLWMACLYEMSELAVPLIERRLIELEPTGSRSRSFYTLRVCKDCRGSWMKAIEDWFASWAKQLARARELEEQRHFPVRLRGGITMMTQAEWSHWRATGEEPDR